MKNAEANEIADHLSTMVARSDYTVAVAAEVLVGRIGQTQKALLARALVAAAVPLIPDVRTIRYADVYVDLEDLGQILNGNATIVTDDHVIELRMSAKQARDAWDVVSSASSSATAVRRSDVVSITFDGIQTRGTPSGSSAWEPTGTVTLNMRDGEAIQLQSYPGMSLVDLGSLLVR